MKRNYFTLPAGCFILILLLFSQCKSKKQGPSEIDPAFTGYVTAFTSGVISNQSVIRVELREPVSNIEPGQEAEENLFDFSPRLKGTTYWVDQKTIEFHPENALDPGEVYRVKFSLSKLIEVPKKLRTLEFQFQVTRQTIRLDFNGVEAYEHDDLTWQRFKGVLSTADYAEEEEVEELFSAKQNKELLSVSWQHMDNGTVHEFVIDSIRRTESKGEAVLQWSGKAIGSEDEGEYILEIPPLGDFKVLNMNVTRQPEQCISIHFSDPLDRDQELDGLIHLDNGAALNLVAGENEVRAYPRQRQTGTIRIMVETGIRNVMNYQLSERYEQTLTFTTTKPDVQLVGNGVILPGSKGLIFPFKAVNLNGVNVKIIKIFEDNVAQFLQVNQFDGTREMKRVGRIVYKKAVPLISDKPVDYGQWNIFSLDLSSIIETEPGAIYRVHISFDQSQSLYPCDDEADQDTKLIDPYTEDKEIADFDDPSNYHYYSDYYYDYNDGYRWSDRNDPCKKSYYLRNNHAIVSNVLASDLGIIAKGGNAGSLVVAVTDIKTTEQLPDVDIEIYNFQNQLVASGKTDSKGLASILLENKPYLLVARKGSQTGYLRLDDGSALSLSMFDVDGREITKGIKGYIYGERGVWRPGDSLFVTFVLEDKDEVIPGDHPVIFELYTPENQLYLNKVKTGSVNGFYDFRTSTAKDAPSGNWTAKVKVGGAVFKEVMKIETIKPNRLKIRIDFDTDILRSNRTETALLDVKWLHGAIAKGLKADVNVRLSEGKTTFDDFPGYVFDDPVKKFDSEEKTIFDGMLNDKGEAKVNAGFKVDKNAPGMLQARFVVRAFEKGGDFSIDRFTMPYSPFPGYVGVKVPEGKGWNGALYSNEPNLLPVVTVDEYGNPVDRDRVKIEIYNISWRWWWERSEDDDLADYIENRSSNLLLTDYVDTKNGKAIYEMNLERRTWGRKLIRVTDPVTGHSAGQLFYTSYKGWWNNAGQDSPGGAEILTFTTDKKKYRTGEEVKVELPAAEKGRALVSIESGSDVIKAFWIETTAGQHSFSFTATGDMAPNVYIHVSYIQPHVRENNDLPIRMYGVQPVAVEDPETHLSPVIEMDDVLEPEKEVTIRVSEAGGKKMSYTLAVVDEGLLDLTRFKTPEAWKYFYAREALGVKTWDMYKYVIGAFTGEMSGLLAIGGDEELVAEGGKKAERFKPVVKFFGPVELKSSGENTHTFTMPNYVGSVRTMLVAGYRGAYGSAEKATPVKKPLMVLATLPRVLGPTERVQLPVTVFAMDSKIKNVSVEIQTNKFFEVNGSAKKSISFEQEGDQVVNFDLSVNEMTGIGKVKIIATSGKEKAEYDVEMDIRLPNPRITKVIDGIVDPGGTWESDYTPVGMAGTNNGVVEVSGIPPLNLEKRLKFLIRYPHGCIEQTTSSVFPQLQLSYLLDLTSEQKMEIEKNIRAGIDKLKGFQTFDGGLSYWPGEYEASDWGTNYAGHFMLEAKARGYDLPVNLLKNWIGYQKRRANEWSSTSVSTRHHYYNSSQLIQAYRLYTLALAGKPAMGAMNRMREINNLSSAAKWRLAATYKLAGRERVAIDMVTGLKTNVEPYKELSYSYGSSERDQAMILETLVLLNRSSDAKGLLDELSDKLASDRWYSTQTTAYTLMAIAKFVNASGRFEGLKYDLTVNGEKERVNTDSPVAQSDLDITTARAGKVSIQNKSDSRLFISIHLDGIPLTGDQTNGENNLRMKVRYLDLENRPLDPARLEQGTDFMAEVTVQHPGIRMDYREMALTQVFPSGWEIRNLRMDGTGSSFIIDKPRYQDIRDDRVYSYFNLDKNQSKTFRVLLNASYAGRFYLPTVYCEAMYDNDINAWQAGKWLEVVPQE